MTKQFLNEIVLNYDGGPNCMRDDCDPRFGPDWVDNEKGVEGRSVHCKTCGKTWNQEKPIDIRPS